MNRRDFILGLAAGLAACSSPKMPITFSSGGLPAIYGSTPTGDPPQILWPGFTDSTHAMMMAWSTLGAGDTGYIFFRNGTQLNTIPIVASVVGPGGNVRAQPWFLDSGLTPGTTYNYTVAAIVNGQITKQSTPPIQLTTLLGPTSSVPSTLPTPALDPATWIQTPPAAGSLANVPSGNTLWQVTSAGSSAGNAPIANPGGGQTVGACGLLYAIGHLNLNGGDTIAIAPGVYNVGSPFINFPVVNGSNGFTNIVSTQAPEYAGAGGTLPAYSTSTSVRYTGFTATATMPISAKFTATIAGTVLTVTAVASGTISTGPIVGNFLRIGQSISSFGTGTGGTGTYNLSISQTVSTAETMTQGGASSATLTAAFTGRTGYYPTKFTPSAGSLSETRRALFTHGSTSVIWTVPLFLDATAAIQAHIGNYVTPWDANSAGLPAANASPSMPIIAFANVLAAIGITMNPGTNNIRCIGIAFQNQSNGTPLSTATLTTPIFHNAGGNALDSMYLDRCILGNDDGLYLSSMGYMTHGILSNSNHALFHQCYVYGIIDGQNGNGNAAGDANGIGIAGGGPICIENCYLEAQAESVIPGGLPIFQNNIPSDLVRRYNFSHKPTNWQLNEIGEFVKNHFECKCSIRVADYGNIIQNSWQGAGSQGQWGRGATSTPRDQSASNMAVATITSVSGNVINIVSNGIQVGNDDFSVGNYCWISGASNGITPMMFKIAARSGTAPNLTLTSNIPFIGTFTSGGRVTPAAGVQSMGPWCRITDQDIHDNLYYDVGAAWYDAGGLTDYSFTSFTARIRFANNQVYINPGNDVTRQGSFGNGLQIISACNDLTIDHNTFIVNSACPNYQTGSAFTSGIQSFGNGNATFTPLNPATTNDAPFFGDRVTITNNILDGAFSYDLGQVSGVGSLDNTLANSTWSNNAAILDSAPYTAAPTNGNFVANHHAAVGYLGCGFSNWISGTASPTFAPTNPSDWNVTTGALATASTTGGPIGAIF